MHIALIAPPWLPVPPPAYGGTEAVVDTLARELQAAGHDVLLLTTGDSTCPVTRSWIYEQARPDDLGNVIVELRHALHAFEVAAGADIIHDHTVAGPLLARRLLSVPVVTTNHGPFTDEVRALYRATAREVPLIALSRHHAVTAGDLPIAGIVHHGLDLSQYPVGDGHGEYLMFLGRMSANKGVHRAIDVAHHVGMPLVIAAKMREPGEVAYFNERIAPRLGGDISYVGEIGLSDKVALLRDAAALVNPLSWDEPFGLCMIEALACGTPVVATRRGAAPEIVDDGVTGFVCTDEREMVAAVRQVASLDRGACRDAVEDRFSAARMAANYLAIYEAAAAPHMALSASSS